MSKNAFLLGRGVLDKDLPQDKRYDGVALEY